MAKLRLTEIPNAGQMGSRSFWDTRGNSGETQAPPIPPATITPPKRDPAPPIPSSLPDPAQKDAVKWGEAAWQIRGDRVIFDPSRLAQGADEALGAGVIEPDVADNLRAQDASIRSCG